MNHKGAQSIKGLQAHLLLGFAEIQTSLFRQVEKLLDEISLANMQKLDHLPKSLNPLLIFQYSTGHSLEVLS